MNISKSTETKEWKCDLCTDDQNAGVSTTIDGYKACSACVRRVFETSISSEGDWPPKWAGRALDIRDFRHALDARFLSKFQKKADEFRCPPKERVYCKQKASSRALEQCNGYIGRRTKASSTKGCPTCGSLACMRCAECLNTGQRKARPVNNASHTCKPKDNDDLRSVVTASVQRGKEYQQCPNTNCRGRFGLRDGCNQMACPSCSTSFCFICGKKAEEGSGHWREGSRCPKWGHPDDEHAQWYDDREGAQGDSEDEWLGLQMEMFQQQPVPHNQQLKHTDEVLARQLSQQEHNPGLYQGQTTGPRTQQTGTVMPRNMDSRYRKDSTASSYTANSAPASYKWNGRSRDQELTAVPEDSLSSYSGSSRAGERQSPPGTMSRPTIQESTSTIAAKDGDPNNRDASRTYDQQGSRRTNRLPRNRNRSSKGERRATSPQSNHLAQSSSSRKTDYDRSRETNSSSAVVPYNPDQQSRRAEGPEVNYRGTDHDSSRQADNSSAVVPYQPNQQSRRSEVQEVNRSQGQQINTGYGPVNVVNIQQNNGGYGSSNTMNFQQVNVGHGPANIVNVQQNNARNSGFSMQEINIGYGHPAVRQIQNFYMSSGGHYDDAESYGNDRFDTIRLYDDRPRQYDRWTPRGFIEAESDDYEREKDSSGRHRIESRSPDRSSYYHPSQQARRRSPSPEPKHQGIDGDPYRHRGRAGNCKCCKDKREHKGREEYKAYLNDHDWHSRSSYRGRPQTPHSYSYYEVDESPSPRRKNSGKKPGFLDRMFRRNN